MLYDAGATCTNNLIRAVGRLCPILAFRPASAARNYVLVRISNWVIMGLVSQKNNQTLTTLLLQKEDIKSANKKSPSTNQVNVQL